MQTIKTLIDFAEDIQLDKIKTNFEGFKETLVFYLKEILINAENPEKKNFKPTYSDKVYKYKGAFINEEGEICYIIDEYKGILKKDLILTEEKKEKPMEIKVEFELDQEVYFMFDNKITSGIVELITIVISKNCFKKVYRITGLGGVNMGVFLSEKLFESKEELIKSL